MNNDPALSEFKLQEAVSFIPDVFEEVKKTVAVTILTDRQYCVILDPVGVNGKNQFGSKKLVKVRFFRHRKHSNSYNIIFLLVK